MNGFAVGDIVRFLVGISGTPYPPYRYELTGVIVRKDATGAHVKFASPYDWRIVWVWACRDAARLTVVGKAIVG